MPPFRAILAALPLALAAPHAFAQDAAQDPGPNITGDWEFEAAPTHREDCTFTGQLTLTPTPDPGVYRCTMVARDHCPDVWDFKALQTCTARRDGDHLDIDATIESVTPDNGNYWPDNFHLTIVDGAHMVGELDSAVITNARFYRGNGPIA